MALDALELALKDAPTRVGKEQVKYDLETCSCPCICGESSVRNLAVGLPIHGGVVLVTGGYKPMDNYGGPYIL